ncbi:Probable G-protein coupled receptor CG31760, partial [Gryllus bimaculatus]
MWSSATEGMERWGCSIRDAVRPCACGCVLQCEAVPGLGFRRGSYKCVCRRGFYFPDTRAALRYYNGSAQESAYGAPGAFECLPCAEGCDACVDDRPCVATLNWALRTTILALTCVAILCLPAAAIFTWKFGHVKVVRAASPALLRFITLGAFFIYGTVVVAYPSPNVVTCTARVWLREIGFALTYGALMLKTWRALLAVRTLVAAPRVVVGRTAEDLKAPLCRADWWDHAFSALEALFLVWGIRLCIVVRKAPSEFNESRFISMAIYNEFLLSVFLNISMLFLQSPANPDLLYIIFFAHTQLTVTMLLGLIFGSK